MRYPPAGVLSRLVACTLTPPTNRAKTRSTRDVFFWVRIEKNAEVVALVFMEFSLKNTVSSAIS